MSVFLYGINSSYFSGLDYQQYQTLLQKKITQLIALKQKEKTLNEKKKADSAAVLQKNEDE